MHDQFDNTPVEAIELYPLDYPKYIEWAIWAMFGSSFFWAFGLPVYIFFGYLLNTYNGWLVLYGLYQELSYENLRYCQTGHYPNCTIQMENQGLWEWFVYPLRRFFVQWILFIVGFIWLSSYPVSGGFVNLGWCYLMYFDMILF